MQMIGVVQLLQVQPEGLKPGDRTVYVPSRLVVVDGLRLEPEGVIGLGATGELIDIHHANHAHSRYRNGINPVSFNFTSHYALMQERFGDHMAVGCAGENIVMECERQFAVADFAGGVAIESETGTLAWLRPVAVATPCVPFSEFALNSDMRPPAEVVKETMQFLDNGRRGFYCRLNGDSALVIRCGARVYLPA